MKLAARERLLRALRESPGGLTRNEIYAQVLHNRLNSDQLTALFHELATEGLIATRTELREVVVRRRVQVVTIASPEPTED